MSTLCLVLVLGSGTAIAAKQITGAQVKNNSLTGKDIKDGTLKQGDLDKKTRQQLAKAGTPGPQGATGASGINAWEEIPSGTTVTGAFVYAVPGPENAGNGNMRIDLPGTVPVALADADVNTDIGADADAACTGSLNTPLAPPGKVCLYLGFTFGASNVTGRADPYGAPNSVRVAFQMADHATTANFHLDGTWAYTAP